MIEDWEEFVKLARGEARCWWSIEFMDGKAIQTIYCEAPAGVGFVVFKQKRYLTPEILENLEKMHRVKFSGEKFEDRVYDACRFLYSKFMMDLKARGLDAKPGRYFYSLKPVSV